MTTPDFSLLETVRLRRPLVHCVSNIVSAGDCANLALSFKFVSRFHRLKFIKE